MVPAGLSFAQKPTTLPQQCLAKKAPRHFATWPARVERSFGRRGIDDPRGSA